MNYSNTLSSIKSHSKVSKKALNTIRDIEKSTAMKGSYFKPNLSENNNTNLQMSNSEFKSNNKTINFISFY